MSQLTAPMTVMNGLKLPYDYGPPSSRETLAKTSRTPDSLSVLQESDNALVNYEISDFIENKTFIATVRARLLTEEHRKWFDFITDIPQDFAVKYAGQRWTQELMSSWVRIDQGRIPIINKALKKAFLKSLRAELIAQRKE